MRTARWGLALTAVMVMMVSGCGGGDAEEPATGGEEEPAASASGPPVRGDADLVIWTDDQKVEAVTANADAFAEENGISVDVQVITDGQSNFVTANTAGNGPDVMVGAHDWIGNLVQNGAIEPLQLTPDQLSGYSELAVKAVTYQEKVYGLPYGVEALALYRNTDIAPDAPATLDDAFAAGQAAVAAGTVESPFNLQQGELGDAYHMEPIYTSMGGFLFGTTPTGDYDAAQLGVGQPGSLAAAQKIYDIGEAGSGILRRSVSGDNSIALFAAGKSPFLVSGPWALTDIRTAGIKYAIQPVPGFAGQAPAQPFMGAQAFFVATNGANKAFGQEFVSNFMNTEEAMQVMFDKANLVPSNTAVLAAVAAANPDVQVFAEAAEGGAPMPAIPAMNAVWEPLGKAYAAIIGGADPAATMSGAGQTIASAIG